MSLSSTLWYIPLPFIMVAQAMPTDTGGISATMIGQAILFLTTVIGILVQIYRENRARRWAKEDAEDLAKKMELEAMKVKQETEKIVRHVGNNVEQLVAANADEAREEREKIKSKLDLNTELTKLAANGPALFRNPDGTQKTIQVEVVNDDKHRVPVEEKSNANPKSSI